MASSRSPQAGRRRNGVKQSQPLQSFPALSVASRAAGRTGARGSSLIPFLLGIVAPVGAMMWPIQHG
jgi:hypothetical protein